MIKESVQQEDITIVNICAPILGSLKYIKQKLTDLKGEINNNTIVGNFNTPGSTIDHTNRKSIRKYWTKYLQDKFHPTAAEHTFFSGEHGRLWEFSNHSGLKLEINYKKKTGKFTTM